MKPPLFRDPGPVIVKIVAWYVAGAVCMWMGYSAAILRGYSHCLEVWRDAMSTSVAPPPDDWPGMNQCAFRAESTHGFWAFVVPKTPPMPAHYREED